MSEVKKIATRVSYGNALVELAKEHDDVYVLDADLAAATQTAIFKKEFPERHIDCGIAECNMMGIAAGLAATGKGAICQFICHVCGRTCVRAGAKLDRLSAPECENRCDTCRYFRR